MSDSRDIRTLLSNPKKRVKTSNTLKLAVSSHSMPTEENDEEPVADNDLPEYAIAVEHNSEQYDDLAAHVSEIFLH